MFFTIRPPNKSRPHRLYIFAWRLHGIQWITTAQESSAIKKTFAFLCQNPSVTLKNTFNDITSCGTDAEAELPIPSVAEGNLTQGTIDEHDCSKAERDDRGERYDM